MVVERRRVDALASKLVGEFFDRQTHVVNDPAKRTGLEVFGAVHGDDDAAFVAVAIIDGVAAALAVPKHSTDESD